MKSLNSILKHSSLLPDNENLKNDSSDNIENKLKNNPVCPICNDRGIILSGDTAYPCTCMQQKKIENQFRHARISRNLLQCRFEHFKSEYYLGSKDEKIHLESAKNALNAAKQLVEHCLTNIHGQGLLFSGSVGTGKTFLAASIANALIEKGKQVLFLVVPDLLDELRATFDKRTELTELDLLDAAREIPLLILDDLGAHNYTDWTKNRLYSILNFRMNEQLPTVVTTNLSLQEMEEYLGDRTTSRLFQMCRAFRLTCGEDIRKQLYKQRKGIN